MKRILITGGSGFIGRNLVERLSECYTVFAPSHQELELLDYDVLDRYVEEHQIDVIVHGAIHVSLFHGKERELYNDMRMFLNLEKISHRVEKLLYFGSGAEFDKQFDVRMVQEKDLGRTIPVTEYGLAKYAMNTIARQSANIYNLRLFGIFGKYELWQIKFLSNLCCKAVFDLPLTVRKDCFFDFLFVDDLPDIVCWFVENTPKWHDYNVCHGQEYRLLELAELIRRISGKQLSIQLLSSERNLDYSASNERLRAEIENLSITPIKRALERLYRYYDIHRDLIDFEVLRKSR
ncbi:NAD(P)-dependent oxidoreductase [Oscillospiraceae bacterium 50-58]